MCDRLDLRLQVRINRVRSVGEQASYFEPTRMRLMIMKHYYFWKIDHSNVGFSKSSLPRLKNYSTNERRGATWRGMAAWWGGEYVGAGVPLAAARWETGGGEAQCRRWRRWRQLRLERRVVRVSFRPVRVFSRRGPRLCVYDASAWLAISLFFFLFLFRAARASSLTAPLRIVKRLTRRVTLTGRYRK